MREINKRQWSKFCGDIVRLNQFGRIEIEREDTRGTRTLVCGNSPLLSMELVRQGRTIVGFSVVRGQADAKALAAMPVLLEDPETITHDVAANGRDELVVVRSGDGSALHLRVFPSVREEAYRSFVSELAYRLSEVRGFVPGYDMDDWFTAERLIRETVVTGE